MENNFGIIQVSQPEMLAAVNRAETDVQVATAKAYPRDVDSVLNKIRTYATMDTETAEDCFYALRRSGESGTSVIEGVSVRLAEIIAASWGNMRVASRIIGNDGRTITAQAVCHDLESNLAVSVEFKRRITNKNGQTYSEDMQVVTGNAASAIAFRNAVLKVVPKSVTKRVIDEIKDVALGKSIDLETRRQRMAQYFASLGVTDRELCDYCGVRSVEQIDNAMVFELRGLANAIKEGSTTVRETFRAGVAETASKAAEIKEASRKRLSKVDKAMKQASSKDEQAEPEARATSDNGTETEEKNNDNNTKETNNNENKQ